jgi:hypothetical protein
MDTLNKLFLVICLIFLFIGCNRRKVIYFYSLDKSQCITVINENNIRFIIDGKHKKVPKDNFIKLDTQFIDYLGDCFHVCWKNEQYEWDVVVDKSKIIESKLDTSRFHFSTSLPTDARGIPTELKFRQEGCAVFSFYSMELSPNKGAIVEY